MSIHRSLLIVYRCVFLSSLIGVAFAMGAQDSLTGLNQAKRSCELKSFHRYDVQTKKEIDETELVHSHHNLVVRRGDLYFILRLDADSILQENLYYKIEGYDLIWYPFGNGLIRSGMFPEGNYNVIVAEKNAEHEMVHVYRNQMQIRANFFHGMRGAVSIAVISVILVLMFFSGRHWFLRKDKRRTVRMLENTVKKRTEQLQEMVEQRELLLKEVHHRVKNNLQVISSLLEMQASRTEDKNVKDAITESQNRVLSIAFIHQNLYQHDDLKGAEIRSFLNELIAHIRQVFELEDCVIKVLKKVPHLFLNFDAAIPLGLIINELLTNSYKYAFVGRANGQIRIELKPLDNGAYYFMYQDNGVGIPVNFDFNQSNSLGLKLIRQLSRQLQGKMEYSFENGSKFEMSFTLPDAGNK